jgi:hypothetical protein
MELRACFITGEGDREVVVTTDGVKVNELPKNQMSYSYFIDADHPLNTQKFQLPEGYKAKFIELARVIYDCPCSLGRKVNNLEESIVFVDDENLVKEIYYLDFILEKDNVKVHYKNLSGGEKKLATLLRYLCDPNYIDEFDIVIIDNIEKEVYFARHAPMIDKLIEYFPDKQLFISTHSPILVGLDDNIHNIYISPYLPKNSLYPIEKFKK